MVLGYNISKYRNLIAFLDSRIANSKKKKLIYNSNTKSKRLKNKRNKICPKPLWRKSPTILEGPRKKTYIQKWGNTTCSEMRKLNIVKMSFPHQINLELLIHNETFKKFQIGFLLDLIRKNKS